MSVKKRQGEILGKKVVQALQKNNFQAEYVEDKETAIRRLLELIPIEGTVGVGGSVTIEELKITDQLAARGNKVYWHNTPGLDPEEAQEIRIKQQTCDCFLTSTNAVTLDGILVNEDGTGNRVSAMIFGPKKVIVVTGINKIVKDVEAAIERIEMIAGPQNCLRLNYNTPCTKLGYCQDCQSERRICNVTTIMRKRPRLTDITVLIIGEELGY